MKDRGERRKRTFHKGIHRKRLCERIWGDSDNYMGGVEGKYRDGKIYDHEDHRKTHSEWMGKRNYKKSDQKRIDAIIKKENEYKDCFDSEEGRYWENK